jgi:hypothetical protein
MHIAFDVGSFYYLPQYLPVYDELRARGVDCSFVFYDDPVYGELLRDIVARERLPARWCADRDASLQHYRELQPRWVVFGNHSAIVKALPDGTRTALLYHGIGIKRCYYDAELADLDLRFVEGPFRLAELQRRHPRAQFFDSGFAKLDPLLRDPANRPRLDLDALGLRAERPTVLYAPTYYPSSIERLPDDWPAQLGDLNLLIKPHFFTLTGEAYGAQRRKLQAWAAHDNAHVAGLADYSLLPYMGSADLLVSEASSALFEFAALDKPIVWCDFLKLRWSYRGPLRFRYRRRMDTTIDAWRNVGVHVARPAALSAAIRGELRQPQRRAAERRTCTEQLIGNTDGRASLRIADRLLAG